MSKSSRERAEGISRERRDKERGEEGKEKEGGCFEDRRISIRETP